MIRRHRGILLGLLAAVLVAGGGVGLLAMKPRLPDPAVADREQLVRWLVLRDLSQEPPETCRILVRRLEEEFPDGSSWQSAAQRLTEPQRARLWENLCVLLEPWFLDKVEHYWQLPETGRAACLDRFLDQVDGWRSADCLRPPAAETGTTQPGLATTLLQRVDEWKAHAAPDQRARIGQFVLAAQTRWLVRQFKA